MFHVFQWRNNVDEDRHHGGVLAASPSDKHVNLVRRFLNQVPREGDDPGHFGHFEDLLLRVYFLEGQKMPLLVLCQNFVDCGAWKECRMNYNLKPQFSPLGVFDGRRTMLLTL